MISFYSLGFISSCHSRGVCDNDACLPTVKRLSIRGSLDTIEELDIFDTYNFWNVTWLCNYVRTVLYLVDWGNTNQIFRCQAQGPLFQALLLIPVPCSFFRSIRNLPLPSTMEYLEWSQIISLMIDECEGVLYGLPRLMSGLQFLLSQRLGV